MRIKCEILVIIIAAGYDIEGTAFFPFGANAEDKEDLGFDFTGILLNHGFSFKLYIAFDQRWNSKI
jgi:hypothetical protein